MRFKNENQVVYEKSICLWYILSVSMPTAVDVTKSKLHSNLLNEFCVTKRKITIVEVLKHLDCARCDKIRLRV